MNLKEASAFNRQPAPVQQDALLVLTLNPVTNEQREIIYSLTRDSQGILTEMNTPEHEFDSESVLLPAFVSGYKRMN